MKGKTNQTGKAIIAIIVSFLLSAAISQNLNGQQVINGEVSKTYQFTLNDGSVISGKILLITDNELVIASGSMGEIRLQKQNIKSMSEVAAFNEKKSGIWFSNPNPTKYLLGSSAIPLEKKAGYYQNTWIFFNSFSYGITKNISLTAGFEIFSLLAGDEGPYGFFINPKASFKVAENFYLGGNILYANTLKTMDDFGGLATLNAFCTYGNKNINASAGLGWGWADGEFSSKPLITLSGMARVAKRLALVSENWLIPGAGEKEGLYGVYSYGLRFLGEKTSIDLAFLNNPDIAEEMFIGIPWLDFVINF